MANNDFDRTVINARERPLSSDINQAQSQQDRTIRDLMSAIYSGRNTNALDAPLVQSGCIGDGLKVRPSVVPGMSVRIAPGFGFLDMPPGGTDLSINSISGLDDLSSYKPLRLLSEVTISGLVAPVTNPRIDIIEVRMNRVVGNPLSRDVLNTISGVFDPTSVNKTLSYTLDASQSNVLSPANSTAAIGYKRGVENAVPVAPAVSPGYMKIGEVRLTIATVSITRAEVLDFRRLLVPSNDLRISAVFNMASDVAAPTLGQLVAPPGVEVALRRAAASPGFMSLYVFAGGFDANSKLEAQCALNGTLASEFYPNALVGGVINPAGLTLGEQTFLNDPAQTANSALFAVGQPYAACIAVFLRQAAGVTNQVFPVNAYSHTFDLSIRR